MRRDIKEEHIGQSSSVRFRRQPPVSVVCGESAAMSGGRTVYRRSRRQPARRHTRRAAPHVTDGRLRALGRRRHSRAAHSWIPGGRTARRSCSRASGRRCRLKTQTVFRRQDTYAQIMAFLLRANGAQSRLSGLHAGHERANRVDCQRSRCRRVCWRRRMQAAARGGVARRAWTRRG